MDSHSPILRGTTTCVCAGNNAGSEGIPSISMGALQQHTNVCLPEEAVLLWGGGLSTAQKWGTRVDWVECPSGWEPSPTGAERIAKDGRGTHAGRGPIGE